MRGHRRLAGGCTLIGRCALLCIPEIEKSYLSKQATYDEKMLSGLQLFDPAVRWAGSNTRAGEYVMRIISVMVSEFLSRPGTFTLFYVACNLCL